MKKGLWKIFTAGFFCALALSALQACGAGTDAPKGVFDLSKATYKVRNQEELVFDGEVKHAVIDLYEGATLRLTVDTADYCSRHGGKAEANGISVKMPINHVNEGEVSVRIQGTDDRKYKGNVTAVYVISPSVAKVSTYAELNEALDLGYRKLAATADLTIPQGGSILIQNEVTLNMQEYALSNYGEINNRGVISLDEGGKIFNYGEFYVGQANGVRATAQSAPFYSNTKLEQETVSNLAKTIAYYRRTDVTYVLGVPTAPHEYVGKAITPVPTFTIANIPETDYTITYTDNVNVGTATVVFQTVNPESHYIFGRKEWSFEITRVTPTAATQAQLETYLADENYTEIILDCPSLDEVEIPSHATVTLARDVQMKSLTVNGKLSLGRHALRVTGDVQNSGELYANAQATVGGKLVNSGTVQLVGTELYAEGLIESTGRFLLTSGAKLHVMRGATGSGYENHGLIYLYGDVTAQNANAAIDNFGKIYTNVSLAGTTDREQGETVLRAQVAQEHLGTYEEDIPYAKKAVAPDVTSVLPTANASDYTLTCFAADGLETSAIRVGNYILRVSFKETSHSFYGSVDLPFSVQPSIAEVKSSEALLSALQDENYYQINVAASFALFQPATVAHGNLRVLQGERLTLMSSLHIAAGKRLVNDGVFLNAYDQTSTDNANVTLDEGAIFENNGDCYTNDAAFPTVGNGNCYVRQPIANAIFSFSDAQEGNRFAFVKNKDVRETAGASLNGVPLTQALSYAEEQKDYYFVNGYTLNALGNFEAEIYTPDLSPYVYGKTKVSYTVVQGTTTVASGAELLNALAEQTEGVGNYEQITLTADITTRGSLSYLPSQITQISIGKNTLLDMRGYTWKHEYPTPNSEQFRIRLALTNHGKLLVDCPQVFLENGASLFTYAQGERGTLEGYADSCEELTLFTRHAAKVTLEKNLQSDTDISLIAYANACEIDLQGYAVVCPQLLIDVDGNASFPAYTVTLKNGTIGSVENCCATSAPLIYFDYQSGTSQRLHLINLTVHGTVRAWSGFELSKAYYTATNCTVHESACA